MASTFNPNVPTGLVPLNQDYNNLRLNNQQLDASFAINHFAFSDGTTNNGKHNFVQFVNRLVIPPGLSSGEETMYSKVAAGQGELFFTRGNSGTEIQLTGPGVPLANTNGYTFLPGGILIQWGFVNGSNGSDNHFNNGNTGTVTFVTSNINFPNNCWSVWFTVVYNTNTGSSPSSEATVTYDLKTISKTKFDWKILTNSSQYTRFYWFAIGN